MILPSPTCRSKRKCFMTELVEPLEALCTNKDRTRVAVAGRTITKIYAINYDNFELKNEKNKPRKTHNFSGSLAWSPLRDNLIASTSSNGAVILWDPESSQSERSYKAHKSAATKVCFNDFNEHLLISGSKDSTVWLYDLRSVDPITCFSSNSDDSIRDVQFCLESSRQDQFVTAGDSGTIRFWDIRKPDRATKEFVAHSSQVYSIALNSKSLIATAGRDKYIRIWDWSKQTPSYLYSIEMMAIVTRVSWCPSNNWHVACCFTPSSGFVSSDNTVFVWDIRRPYLPFASFDSHTKTCTDMSWPRQGPGDKFLSCGKDGRLIMNFMEEAHRPIRHANTVAIDYSSPFDGMIVSVPSCRRKVSSPSADSSDPFRRKVPSTLFCATPVDPFIMTSRSLSFLGENYKLVGGTVDELCEHNARVAERLGRDQIAYSWRMIALLCAQTDLGTVRPQFFTKDGFKRVASAAHLGEQKKEGDHRHLHDSDSSLDSGVKEDSGGGPTVLISGSLSIQQNPMSTNTDFFFGVEELNLDGLDAVSRMHRSSYSRQSIASCSDISKLKEEAFDFRSLKRSGPGNRTQVSRMDSVATVEEEQFDEDFLVSEGVQSVYSGSSSQENLSGDEIEVNSAANITSLFFDPLPRLKSILDYYSQMGDVQMCATICMVIGERVIESNKPLVRPNQVELWFYNYLELLEKLQLWRPAAVLVKTCFRPKLNQLSKESTFVKVLCTSCRSTSMKSSSRCKSCKKLYNYRCCICELTVRGVWSSCVDCGHGGHLWHLEEWFSQAKFCPYLDCGCQCQQQKPTQLRP